MSELVIKAEHISKKYRLGVLGSGSLKQDVYKYWNKLTGAAQKTEGRPVAANEILALKDVSFSIARGEVLGFIGKNGAGKSTLLKILSRVALPSSGSIKGIGKIASLLDVGTGFHPELTGRENVFLNGQILGMTRKGIRSKFDEIIDFSGVGKFIDTPIKRYSSGMYVRLAFAVAANLDPDILIVDEALSVGDAEFQAKCIQKMRSISGEQGKTVLFVSHNMQSMRDLCQRIICMDHGTVVDDDKPGAVIAKYLTREKMHYLSQQYEQPEHAPGNGYIRIKSVAVQPGEGKATFDTTAPIRISINFWQYAIPGALKVGIHVYDFTGTCIFDIYSTGHEFSDGLVSGECVIPGGFLNPGNYYISFYFLKDNWEKLWAFEACLSFDIQNADEQSLFKQSKGYVTADFPVILKFQS
jgi:lipopolysaccharide transport system ATP-binding protein